MPDGREIREQYEQAQCKAICPPPALVRGGNPRQRRRSGGRGGQRQRTFFQSDRNRQPPRPDLRLSHVGPRSQAEASRTVVPWRRDLLMLQFVWSAGRMPSVAESSGSVLAKMQASRLAGHPAKMTVTAMVDLDPQ